MVSAVVSTRQLSKRYGQQFALKDLDLEVQAGEVLAYLGPNGAGKTTTIRLLLGLITPTSGSATIFGLDVREQAPEAHRRLAYVPGEPNLWPSLTGRETLALLGRVQGQVDTAYRDQLIERFDFDPTKKVRAYSKGNRQKLSLIAALMTRAELLVLDEPTSGLDPLMEQAFRQCIREATRDGQTVFLSSHILSEVEALCDRVAILRKGELLEMGTLAEMRHLSAFSVQATFEGPPPDISHVPGVSNIELHDHGALRGGRVDGGAGPRAVRFGTPRAAQHQTLVGGAVPRALRRRGSELMSIVIGQAQTLRPITGIRGMEHSGDPCWAIAAHVFRRSRRWALIWGAVLGLYVVVTVRAFTAAYPTLASRVQLAHSLQPFSMLLGLPRHAETVAGFASWRVLTAAILIGGIWGLLTSTGLLRGEEDAGRWELLLVGQTTRQRAAGQALVGFGWALGAMFLMTAPLTLAAGSLPGARFGFIGSLLFAVALVAGAAMFLAIGALASQLRATRGEAATLAAGVLGGSWVVRMLADSSPGLGWLRWLSPMGWIEELHPLQDAQPLALIPIVALVLACAALTTVLAGRRDLNASVIPERAGGPDNAEWLVGPISLAMRVGRPVVFGWLAAIVGYAAMEGALARSAANLLATSPAIVATLGRLGVRRATEGFLGMAFFFDAVLIAVLAASQIAAIRDEEASGRLDNLLVRPVTRLTWLAGRIGISLAILLLAGLGAGLSTWLGAVSQHVNESVLKLLEAGLNATVPGIFVLLAGVLVLGLRPRLSAAAAYGIVAWSFLVDLIGSLIKGADWLRDSSLFTHMALAPAANPEWGTAAVIVLLGAAAAVIGAIAFRQRDIEYA